MIGLAIILPLNYPNLKTAKKVLDRASAGAMLMYITLIGAGILIGVFDKSGIMEKMGVLILNFVSRLFRRLYSFDGRDIGCSNGNYFLYRFLFLWSDAYSFECN